MAKLSVEDGLVMQIHPGSDRNHSPHVFHRYGPDKGFDIPKRVDFVEALEPLLQALGHERNLCIILFTLDESTYARELAPLAAACPFLKLGPAWWSSDSPDGHDMARRIDCAFLATQVAEHRLPEEEAVEVAIDLAYRLAKRTYGYEDLV